MIASVADARRRASSEPADYARGGRRGPPDRNRIIITERDRLHDSVDQVGPKVTFLIRLFFTRSSAERSCLLNQKKPSCASQASTVSPLLMPALTRPSTINVGVVWMPFCRAYLACHFISRLSAGNSKGADTWVPL